MLALLAITLPRRCVTMSASKVLDRSKIREEIRVGTLVVPAKRTGEFLGKLRPHLLNVARTRNVVDGAAPGTKQVLLSRDLPVAGFAGAIGDAAARDWVAAELASGGATAGAHVVALDYDYFTAEEALKRVLPAGVDAPTSFEAAGHVAHLNLRPEHEPYKRIIGEILLDKVATVRTVVNKVGDIANEFRTYDLEILAGDPDTKVALKEQGCHFEFDVRDVYWNSRLQAEHGRLLETVPAGSLVADCTCGVGPFSVPLAAKRRIRCYANDLNPKSVEYLRVNKDRNRCGDLLEVRGPGCARDFLRGLVAEGLQPTHAIYNLPASGIELLDAFQNLELAAPVVVHCYCFAGASKGGQAGQAAAVVADVKARCEAAVGSPLPESANGGVPLASPDAAEAAALAGEHFVLRWVRNVAPSKDMYCASFTVRPERGAKRAKVEPS